MQKTEELFHRWNADRRLDTFEGRLLATRLKARLRCTLHIAYQGMSALGADETFEKLIYDLKIRIAKASKQNESTALIARRTRILKKDDAARAKGKKSVALATWLQAPDDARELNPGSDVDDIR